MKPVWSMIFSSLRGYRTFARDPRSRTTSWDSERSGTLQSERFPEIEDEMIESRDYDFDKYESDFSSIGGMDKMHEQEIAMQKQRFKNRIVKQKYFNDKEPATLTWGEREQIRHLHSEDPVEWCIDSLTESFPASRETISKILRAKWLPRSARVIENYDAKVKKNWELLKADKLAVRPELLAHLLKFKNREIHAMDEETKAKLVRTKPSFPTPTSIVFSNIIRGYDDGRARSKKNAQSDAKTKGKSMKKLADKRPSNALDMTKIASLNNRHEATTCDVFLEKYTQRLKFDDLSPVARVIVDETKQQTAEAYKSKSLVFESRSIIENYTTLEPPEETKNEENSCREVDENVMETGIIERTKRIGITPDDYPQFIKIADKKYKPGVMYKIEDRYYDEDGEFLYRVPGMLA